MEECIFFQGITAVSQPDQGGKSVDAFPQITFSDCNYDAGKMKGSALVLEFNSRAELDDYLASEPYITEGVWQKVEVETMNVVILNGEKRK